MACIGQVIDADAIAKRARRAGRVSGRVIDADAAMDAIALDARKRWRVTTTAEQAAALEADGKRADAALVARAIAKRARRAGRAK